MNNREYGEGTRKVPASTRGNDWISDMMRGFHAPNYGCMGPPRPNYASENLHRMQEFPQYHGGEPNVLPTYQHADSSLERRTQSLDARAFHAFNEQTCNRNFERATTGPPRRSTPLESQAQQTGYPDPNGRFGMQLPDPNLRSPQRTRFRDMTRDETLTTIPDLEEREPVKRALVIMQGGFSHADVLMVHDGLDRIGFDKYKRTVVVEKERVTKEVAERLVLEFCQGLSPRSNLLLVAATLENGIELSAAFLAENLYRPILNWNKQLGDECKKAMKNAGKCFDGRRYEGVTLHVVLDGVKGCHFPWSLTFKVTNEDCSPYWDKLPQTQERRPPGDCSAKTGRIFQLCADYRCVQYTRGALLHAFVANILDEARVTYRIFALRMLARMHHRFTTLSTPKAPSNPQERAARGCRDVGALAVSPIGSIVSVFLNYLTNLRERRNERILDTKTVGGNTVFSSSSCFDPEVSLAFEWRDA